MSAAKGNEMTGVACTSVTRSVIQALLIAFLQRRFPGMAAPADAGVEGWRPQSAEENERASQQIQRKFPLLLQTQSLLASFRESARAQPALFVRGEAVRGGPLVENVLGALGRAVHAWVELRLLSDHVDVPQNVAPVAGHASVFLHPLPDLSLLHCLEVEKPGRGRPDRPVRALRIGATYCKHKLSTALACTQGMTFPDEGDKGVGASIGVPAPGGGACLSGDSHVPVSQFLHPEDPASIVAAFLARQASIDARDVQGLLKDFEVENQVREAAGDVPRLDFLHCKRAVRRRLFFWRKRVEHFVYMVMRRQDAARLGILARVRALPPRDQALLRKHFGFCPEDPVAARIELPDDSDGGGGEEPPPPPPPEPERREELEGAPASDKVAVG
jgi:hypothetical protein